MYQIAILERERGLEDRRRREVSFSARFFSPCPVQSERGGDCNLLLVAV